jgi:glycosyltransferase involved in cell wall biosynthesis
MDNKKLKICVYAIAKNEEKFVERFYESSKDADIVLLADTGSTDRTVELAHKVGMTVHEIYVSPWRFDEARNAALHLIPKDVDVCVSLDLDEELQPGWREEIERVWEKGVTNRLRYKFDWGVGIVFYYEKIHGRSGFTWANMCHEVVATDPRVQDVWAHTDMLLVIHKPDNTKSRGQYLDLLKADVTDNPRNPRNAFYYARELSFNSKWQEAIDECERYLNLPGADWINERCYARRVQGRSYDEMGNGHEALMAFRKACFEAPNTREPWVDLAESCRKKQMWNECFYASTQALSITERELVYTVDPAVWGSKPYDLAALSAWNLGLKDKAAEYGQLAVDADPYDERLKNNLEWYKGNVK